MNRRLDLVDGREAVADRVQLAVEARGREFCERQVDRARARVASAGHPLIVQAQRSVDRRRVPIRVQLDLWKLTADRDRPSS